MASIVPIYKPARYKAHDGITADQEATVAAVQGLKLMGYACRESAGTPAVATFRIMNGATVAAGKVVAPVELAANASGGAWYGPDGIDCSAGLTIDVVAGTVDVTLFYKLGNE